MDSLRQAFVDRTLEVSLHAASKALAGAAFAKITPDKPTGPDAKARKDATDMRKTAAAAEAVARPTLLSKPTGQARPPPRKWWCGPPRRFVLPDIFLHVTSRTSKMAGVGAHRRERPSPKLDPPWRARQVQTRHTPEAFQPRHLYAGRFWPNYKKADIFGKTCPRVNCKNLSFSKLPVLWTR
jgi:hypothetical protein